MPSSNQMEDSEEPLSTISSDHGGGGRGRKMIKTLSNLVPGGGRRSRSSSRSERTNSSRSSYKPPTPTRTTSSSKPIANDETTSQPPSNSETTSRNNSNPWNQRQEKKRQERHHRKNIKRYRGFSTSISSLFLDEQVVCASISWCGLLASSKTEYLLNVRNEQLRVNRSQFDKAPSTILGILLIWTVAFISLTYLIWGFGNVDDGDDANMQYKYYGRALLHNDEDTYTNYTAAAAKYYVPGVMRFCDYNRRFWAPAYELLWSMVKTPTSPSHDDEYEHRHLNKSSSWMDNQDLASDLRTFACFTFFCILGLFGRRRRMQSRFAVLKARQHDDQIHLGNFRRDTNDLKREDKYAGACSHTLCGCYPVDRKILKDGMKYDNDDDEIAPGFKKKHEDSMNSLFSCIMCCCCGKLCHLWCQCFSICALAQEAREVRLLVPPKSQHVDLITHQPWKTYFKDIYDLRISWKEKQLGVRRSWASHFQALSTLSRTILVTFIVATVVIIVTEQFNPRAAFSWADACVLLLTFVQSFIVLGIVHGLFHKSDLSLDAVIKFFAAGFVIATPVGYLFEALAMFAFGFIFYTTDLILKSLANFDMLAFFDGNSMSRPLMFIADFVQAFFIAAMIEELCKYYAFRTVEHPDLIFLTGLHRYKRDRRSGYGGNMAYTYTSDNNALISKHDTFDCDYSKRRSESPRSYRGDSQSPSRRRKKVQFGFITDNEDVRTLRQKAAAITTAMISVAVGLACAENFMYVFFLGGSNAQEEFAMLVLRSIFPVHALCAAIQSIGIIQKFLEEPGNNPVRLGVGRIVLPAVILHGSFDCVLMTVNSFIDIAAENAANNGGQGDDNFALLHMIAGLSVVTVMVAGLLWYYRQNRIQKSRLKISESSSRGFFGKKSSEVEDGIELL